MSLDEQNLKIVGRNIEITDDIKDYIYKKISKLDRYIPKISSLEVTINKEKYVYNINILLHPYNKKMIRLSSKDKNLKSAVDLAIDKIKTVAVKFKEKTTISKKKHSNIDKYSYQDINEFVKSNTFVQKMSQKEAIQNLINGKENSIIFFNTDTNKFSIATKNESGIEITDIDIKE